MSLVIRFTPAAEDTYAEVIEQLRHRWGEKFVKKFEDKLSKAFELIGNAPFLYPVAYEQADVRKCVLHKNCSMFYKLYDDYILILWFWDNRQEPLL